MITTTDAPAWLRRSDQAVTWARTMLSPAAPSSSTARQQICRAAYVRSQSWTPPAGSCSIPL